MVVDKYYGCGGTHEGLGGQYMPRAKKVYGRSKSSDPRIMTVPVDGKANIFLTRQETLSTLAGLTNLGLSLANSRLQQQSSRAQVTSKSSKLCAMYSLGRSRQGTPESPSKRRMSTPPNLYLEGSEEMPTSGKKLTYGRQAPSPTLGPTFMNQKDNPWLQTQKSDIYSHQQSGSNEKQPPKSIDNDQITTGEFWATIGFQKK